VLLRRADVNVPHAIEWSRDGAQLLSQLEMKNGTYQMALVASSDGTLRTLKDFGGTRSLRISLSPDGRFVAYDHPQRPDRPMRDIFILATDGSGEWPLVEHPANDLFPQWAPDGNRVIFASERTGSLGLWTVRVAAGRALEEPQLLSRDMGHMDPLGVTRDGTFYYHLQTGLVDVYTASISPSTGTVIGKPEPVAPNYIGSNISSGWSSDARRLAYVSIRSPAGSDRFSRMLAIRETDSGEQRDLWPALAFFMGPSWSPDGRRILVRGMDLQQRCCIHQIDVDTGRVSPAMLQERVPDAEGVDQQAWTPDGKGILYVRGSKVIMSRDLTTGADATLLDIRSVGVDRLTPGGNGNPTFEISPDGRSIAFSGWIGTGAEARSVIDVVPLGGVAREILRAPEPLLFQGWTPDGFDLQFVRSKSRGDDLNALWRIPAAGGQPRPIGLEMVGLRDVHISPDGTRLTFTAGWQTGDVRTIENFLPR
jgi:Tol biopolymer transport system component